MKSYSIGALCATAALLSACRHSAHLTTSIRNAAVEHNQAKLDALVIASAVTDARVFAAASDLAANRSATRAARLAGFHILIRQTFGENAFLVFHTRRDFRSVTIDSALALDARCSISRFGAASHTGVGDAARIPDLVRTAQAILEHADDDPTVLNVARCIDNDDGAPEARLAPKDVQLIPQCGLLLSVGAKTRAPVTLAWAVHRYTGFVMIRPDAPTLLAVPAQGTVVVSSNGKVLAKASTSPNSC